MKVVNKKEERVKILIGKNIRGESNLKKPFKSIIIYETNVDEVFNKISKCLESADE